MFFYQWNENLYNKCYNDLSENIKSDKNSSIDFEISAESIVLKRGIATFNKDNNGYSLINIYKADKKIFIKYLYSLWK